MTVANDRSANERAVKRIKCRVMITSRGIHQFEGLEMMVDLWLHEK